MVKKGDFVKIEYTGRIKITGKVFDTSDEEIAKTKKIHNPSLNYGPLTICVGEGNVMKGLDAQLEGKEINKDYEVDISAEKAFGAKNPKLMKTIPKTIFTKQKMNPYPGLQINAEGMLGTVRSVSGGRVILDFNHPLAGRDLVYDFKIVGEVKDVKEKIDCLMNFSLKMLGKDNFKIQIVENNLKITSKMELPEQLRKMFEEKVKKLVPEIKKIEFLEEKSK